MSGADRYRRVLQTPHVPRMLGAMVLARLPIGITALALVLFLREETGSYATAGATAAAFAIAIAATSPVLGRVVDRRGPGVLLPLSLLHGAALVAIVVLALNDAPAGAVVVAALAAGAALPPLSSVMRMMWPGLLHAEPGLVSTAFALDSVLIELIFVVGPIITALLTALDGPQDALYLSAILGVAGTVAFLGADPARELAPAPGPAGRHGRLGALASPGLRTIILTTIPFGFCFGAVEVTLPAFSEDNGSRAAAGALLAVWSLASAAGGLAYGARDRSAGLAAMYVRLGLLLPLGFVPLLAAGSIPVMALLILPAGLLIAPVLTSGNQLVGSVAPPGMVTEAYTWPTTALVTGIAMGNAAAGALVEAANWRVAIAGATVVGALGGLAAFARRSTLSPPPAPAPSPAA